jgi:hypothetical protein
MRRLTGGVRPAIGGFAAFVNVVLQGAGRTTED